MNTKSVFILKLMASAIFAAFVLSLLCCSGIEPTAKSTPTGGPTIEQAQKEDYMGPKARVAVSRFEDKSAKGFGRIGDGMAEMLGNALFSTNRYIVLERQALGDVLQEQDLGASGRVKKETAAKMGEIEGADLLIQGTITEFEPGASGAGGGLGGLLPGAAGVVGGILGGVKTSHVALIVKVIDTKTGRLLASEQVEGKATDIGGGAGLGGGSLAGAFGGYSKTPMEKAIRISINEAVKAIVAKTPANYYRFSTAAKPAPAVMPPSKTSPPPPAPTPTTPPAAASITTPSPPSKPPPATPAPPAAAPLRTAQVTWATVNLREGPGTNYKVVGTLNKGTSLAVFEEKGTWVHVRLEDGKEAWVSKTALSIAP